MANYTPADVIQLPRLTAAGAMALGEQLLTAAKPHHSILPSAIAKVLGMLQRDHGALKGALRDHVSPPADDKFAAIAADRDIDACWSGLYDFLGAHAKLPGVPEAAEAETIRATIFDDGLKFTQIVYKLEWAESEAKIERIKAQKLDDRIGKLGGQLFLDTLLKAHDTYGKVLGLTAVAPGPAALPPSVRDAMDTFAATLRKYVAKVIGAVDEDEPETQALADALLAPLAAWDVGPSRPGQRAAADETAADAGAPAAGGAAEPAKP